MDCVCDLWSFLMTFTRADHGGLRMTKLCRYFVTRCVFLKP